MAIETLSWAHAQGPSLLLALRRTEPSTAASLHGVADVTFGESRQGEGRTGKWNW